MSTSRWPVVCACGERWSDSEWRELPSVGVYDAGRDGKWDLRTCVCGATLKVTLDDEASTARPTPA